MRSVEATPLIYSGTPPAAESGDVQPISFETVRATPPALLSGLPTTPCGEPVTIDLPAIESALLYGELDRAEADVSAAVAWAPCAQLDAPQLSALMRTWAIVAAHQDGPAQERFAVARTLFPDMTWDERFAPRYREPFEDAQPETRTTQLTVLPGQGAHVDGAPAGPDLSIGRHAVAIDNHGAWVELLDAPDTLVLPSAFPEDALAWIADDQRRSDLTALLAVSLGEGERAQVLHDGVVWEGVAGRTDWTAITGPIPQGTAGLGEPIRRTHHGKLLAISGGALAAVGLGLAAGGYASASASAEPSTSVTGAQRQRRYNTGRTLSQLGIGLAIGGGLATGGGLTWSALGAP